MLAGGCGSSEHKKQYEFQRNLIDDLEDYVRNVTSPSITNSELDYAAEHKHECQGAHWPAVLPSDVVLAGRVLVKHIQQQSYDGAHPNLHAIVVSVYIDFLLFVSCYPFSFKLIALLNARIFVRIMSNYRMKASWSCMYML